MSEGFFDIQKLDDVILIRTSGDWSLSLDVAYLGELSEVFLSARNRAFTVFVDMRGWKVPDSVRYTKIKNKLHLDRRSQQAEFWLSDNLKENEYLLEFFKEFHFPLVRITDEAQAWDLLSNKLCPKTRMPTIIEWFNREN